MDINLQTYEEYFLMYVDGELDGEGRAMVDNFVKQHPQLAGELEAFKHTVQHPDMNVVFADKHLLLREETTGKRIVAFGWWRMAAAAVIVLAAGVGLWRISSARDKEANHVAVITPNTRSTGETQDRQGTTGTPSRAADAGNATQQRQSPFAGNTGDNNGAAAVNPSQQDIASNPVRSAPETKGLSGKQRIKASAGSKGSKPATEMVSNNRQPRPGAEAVPDQPVTNPEPSEERTGLEETSVPETALATVDVQDRELATGAPDVAVAPQQVNTADRAWTSEEAQHNEPSALPVQYADEREEEEDKIYFANTTIPRSGKLRVVFRKASRFLERVTSPD